MKTGNVHALAAASLGVFKPLPLTGTEAQLRKALKDERELRIAAVRALSQDAEEDAKTTSRIAELEGLLAGAVGERDSAQAAIAAAQKATERAEATLAKVREQHASLKDDHAEESRLRSQAEAMYTASMTSLDDANKALDLVRKQLLESEKRVTTLVAELRRPVAPAAPVPYFLEVVERGGPGGDLRKLRLSPDLTPKG